MRDDYHCFICWKSEHFEIFEEYLSKAYEGNIAYAKIRWKNESHLLNSLRRIYKDDSIGLEEKAKTINMSESYFAIVNDKNSEYVISKDGTKQNQKSNESKLFLRNKLGGRFDVHASGTPKESYRNIFLISSMSPMQCMQTLKEWKEKGKTYLIQNLYGDEGKYDDINDFLRFITRSSDSLLTSEYSPKNILEKRELSLITSDYWDLCLLANCHTKPIFFNNYCFETFIFVSGEQTNLRVIDTSLSGFCPRLMHYIIDNSSIKGQIKTTSVHLKDLIYIYFFMFTKKFGHGSWSYEYEFTQGLNACNLDDSHFDNTIITLRNLMIGSNFAPFNSSNNWNYFDSTKNYCGKKYKQPFITANNNKIRDHDINSFLRKKLEQSSSLLDRLTNHIENLNPIKYIQYSTENNPKSPRSASFSLSCVIEPLEIELHIEANQLYDQDKTNKSEIQSGKKSGFKHLNILDSVASWRTKNQKLYINAYAISNIKPLAEYLASEIQPAYKAFIYTHIGKQFNQLFRDLKAAGLTTNEIAVKDLWIDTSETKLLILDKFISHNSDQSNNAGKEISFSHFHNKKCLSIERELYYNYKNSNIFHDKSQNATSQKLLNKINLFFETYPNLDPQLFIFTGDCVLNLLGLQSSANLSAFHLEDLGEESYIHSNNIFFNQLGMGSLLEIFLNPNCYFVVKGYKFLSLRLELSMLTNKYELGKEDKSKESAIKNYICNRYSTSISRTSKLDS